MRNSFRVIAAIFVFTIGATAAFATPVRADVNWSGPGWYVEGPTPDPERLLALLAGPYSDKAGCESEKVNGGYTLGGRDASDLLSCGYEASDPNKY